MSIGIKTLGGLALPRQLECPELDQSLSRAQTLKTTLAGNPVIYARQLTYRPLTLIAREGVAWFSRQQADTFIALGFRLGFGGAMSYEGSTRIRELARSLPLESIVLETDAPDIPPAWARGERNLPQNLARYARILAELRRIDVEEVIEKTGLNLMETLGGWQPH